MVGGWTVGVGRVANGAGAIEEGVKVHGDATGAARVAAVGGEWEYNAVTAAAVVAKGRSE